MELPRQKSDPELEALIEKALNAPPMTAEEIRAQKISFVYGQLMDAAPEITKEQIAAELDKLSGR